ncbi:hypothetical protein [Borrelia hermsii]|uniref:hypothetical protein n=1 Tax=Borrelia hermsii TaxID=140 RepID=UPI00046D20D9|nr:hypothetical protein [Borrelia hermsii]
MVFLKKFCLIFFFLTFPNFLFSESSFYFKEDLGLKTKFSLLFPDEDKKDFFGTGVLNFSNEGYLGFCLNYKMLEFGVAPSFIIQSNDHYFSFNKLFFNLSFNDFIFKIGKQNYYLGNGLMENIVLKRTTIEPEWFFEFYYFISNYSVSLGTMLEKESLDKFLSPKHLSPWLYFQASFDEVDLLAMVELPFSIENTTFDITMIFDILFEIYRGVFFYSTLRQDLFWSKNYKFDGDGNRFLIGLRYYISFENAFFNDLSMVFESYSKSNNYFLGTGVKLTWVRELLQTTVSLRTNLNIYSLQFYFENSFLILKEYSLKLSNILEFNKKLNLKDTPFYNMLSIELIIEL